MRYSRNLSPAQKAKATERRRRMRDLCLSIRAMDDSERAQLAAQCPVITVEGRQLSTFNQCLLATQLPSATIVGGFRQWRSHGRSVSKGQHGLGIWCPSGGKKADTSKNEPSAEDLSSERPNFFMGTVFDVSQTVELSHDN